MVALVRDRDNLIAEAEREQQLGGVGDEADDPHPVTVMPLLTNDEIGDGSPQARPRWHRLKAYPFRMTAGDQEVEERLADGDWRKDGTAIVREWTFADFAAGDRVRQSRG